MTVNHKNILRIIDAQQRSNFCPLKDFRDKSHIKKQPTKNRGLYWIWTNLSLDELQEIPQGGIKEVPIKELVIQRRSLMGIIDTSKIVKGDGFTIVYNGKGNRERIRDEFKCGKANSTGTLNIENRLGEGFNIENWAVSYFDFDANKKLLDEYHLSYKDAEDLERNWRIEYGTPILTRH